VILFLALTLRCFGADDKIPAPDFSCYPQTEAFQCFIQAQTNVNWNLVQRSNILTIVSFLGSDRVGLQYFVNERGYEFDVRFVYDFAGEASHSKKLTEGQIEGLRSAIKKLPAKNILPPIDQLVVVSFKDNTSWVTHVYDRTNLPSAMRQIYDIIGERFETKDKIR
jgi:hypothetical protein